MLSKNSERGLCPFNKFKSCNEKCSFYRSGVRFNEKTEESFPFEDCAINIIADNLEAMHNRSYMMQKEVGETKNIITMKILHDLGKCPKEDMDRTIKSALDMPKKEKLLK